MNRFSDLVKELYESWKGRLEEWRYIRTCKEQLKENDFNVRWNAVKGLCTHYWKEKKWRRITAFLESTDYVARASASSFLCGRAGVGADIIRFHSVLERRMNRSDRLDCGNYAWLLAYIHFSNKDWKRLETLFHLPDWFLVHHAMHALRITVSKCYSLEPLERLERVVGSMEPAPRIAAREPQNAADHARRVYGTVEFLQFIAQRKSELAKQKDGELLAGETIARPHPKCGIYRTVLRRPCHA